MEEILARARKLAQEAEVFLASSEETPVQFEANRLKHMQNKQSTLVALRVVKDGKIGYATSTNPNDAESLVRNAVATAEFGMTARFEFPPAGAYPRVEVFDPQVESVPTEKMVELGEEMLAAVRRYNPEIVCEAEVSRATMSIRIINSRGGQSTYRKSLFSLGIEGNLTRDTDMLFVGESEASCHPILDTKQITVSVLRQLELAGEMASIQTGNLPAIFTPHGVAGALLMPLMTAFNGKIVMQGASPVGNKRGQQVFDTNLTIHDDATIDYAAQSRPCDDEGVPSQRTPLIEKGTVGNFLYDLQTAALTNNRSTGSGQRGRAGLPSPSPSALVIAPGETSFDQMVADIKEGLVIEQLIGAGQGNVLGGEFSGNVLLGYKIENSKIVGRVKNTMVSGNIYQVLKQVTIGSDARWVGGFARTPSICIPSLSVSSK